MGDLTKDFSTWEFACPCCGKSKMNIGTVQRVQRVRDEFGKPISIIEGGGYRCARYEPDPDSSHRIGMAIDLNHSIVDHFELLDLFLKHGFTGIGDKCKNGRYKLHADDAPKVIGVRFRPWKWTYDT